jgi:hypothetical protein
MAKRVEFLTNFDHNIPPFGRVTVTYKLGEVRLVSEACYAAAMLKDAVTLIEEDEETTDEEVNEADGIG